MSDDLAELFRAEVRAHTETILGMLEALETDPEDTGRLAELHRAAHSLRGAARIMGLANAERAARAMETCITPQGGKPRPLADWAPAALRRGVEQFTALLGVGDAELAAWDGRHRAEVDALVAALSGESAGAAAAPASARVPPRTTAPPQIVIDPALLEIFRLELEAHAGGLAQALLALEADPGQSEPIDRAMRAAHSIKGAARVVGVEPLVQLAHAMEDHLVAVRGGSAALDGDRLLRGTDLLAELSLVSTAELLAAITRRAAEIAAIGADVATAARERPSAPAAAPAAQPTVLPAATPAPALPAVAPAPPAAAAVQPGSHVPDQDRVVRVSAAVIDRLMGLAGESLVEARRLEPFSAALHRQQAQQAALAAQLDALHQAIMVEAPPQQLVELAQRVKQRELDCRRQLAQRVAELEEYARSADDLGRRLYGEAIASRMRPLADGVRGLPRLVRDLSRSLLKQVDLIVEGEEVGVDRDILEKIEAPLNHIIRNALDHGIESPSERIAADKPPRATLRLTAHHSVGFLVISISDDGRGIDPARVRAKIVARGLASRETADALSDTAVLDYLFLPGFSTADTVTEISGRGVGLDVVHNVVRELGGSVRVSSSPGRGTNLHLHLPITRSVVRGLVVEIAGDPYAFPLTRIERVLQLPAAEMRELEGRPFFVSGGRNIGLVDGHQVLELEGTPPGGASLCVVVIGDRAQQVGVVVDRLLGESDLVVRRLDPRLGKVGDVSAAAILADGRPVLILDVEDMLRSISHQLKSGQLQRVGQSAAAAASRRKRVLVVDDSISVREVERQLLTNRGYEVVTAVDGMDGWYALRAGNFDLLITDVDMPRMDGIELTRSVKQDAALRKTPVMIVSYRDREEDRIRGMEAGANHYLTKSHFHDESLLSAVIELIGEPDA